MNVATVQPPAGAGNVDVVFVPGATVKVLADGALTIIVPDPPDPPAPPPFAFVPPPPPPATTKKSKFCP